MFGRNQVSDKDLLKAISQRLARTGTSSQSKVNVAVQQGNVTLSGTLQHAIQRSPIVKTVTRVAGVRRVVDQMQHVAKKRLDAHGNVHVRETASVVRSSSANADEPAVTEVEPAAEQPRSE